MSSNFADLDLSHLTSDERRIIDDVLRRQQQEEERNALIIRGLQEDYKRIASAIRSRIVVGKVDSDLISTVTIPNGSSDCFNGISAAEAASMCQLCRTHIPDIPIDGIRIAHCHYCGLRVCYRCGTTLTYETKPYDSSSSKNMTIWTCFVCKKRREFLVKSGQWAFAPAAADAEFEYASNSSPVHVNYRSRSQEPRPLVVARPDNVSRTVRGQVVPLPGQPLDLRRYISSSALLESYGNDSSKWASDSLAQSQPRYSPRSQIESTTAISNTSHSEHVRPYSASSFNQNTAGMAAEKLSSTLPKQGSMRIVQSLPRLTLGTLNLPQDFKNVRIVDRQIPHNKFYSEVELDASIPVDNRTGSVLAPSISNTVFVANGRTASSSSIPYQNTPVFSVGRSALRKSRLAAMGHQDSLSSDPSSDFGGGMANSSSSASYANASPNIPALSYCGVHKSRSSSYHNRRTYYTQGQHSSFSSSEDEMRSTPDFLSESDLELEVESGSVSERCELDSYRSGGESGGESWRPSGRLISSGGLVPLGAMTGSGVVDPLTCGSFQQTSRGSPSQLPSRPKLVRFQRGHSVDNATVPVARDSGLETASSTQTLNEDGSKFRMDWQRSLDGSKLIGKFSILRNNRSESSSRILGLKVVGGRLVENGQIGAVVTKVKKGSVADAIGRIRPGDEVVEWNGMPLVGMSYEQVFDVIGTSRDVHRLEVVVHRHLLGKVPEPSRTTFRRNASSHSSIPQLSQQQQQLSAQISQPESDLDAGRLQLKFWIDHSKSELWVTVVSARDLFPIGVSSANADPPPIAFCTITLLPNQLSPENRTQCRRWTDRHPASWEPRWNQKFSLWPVSDQNNTSVEASVFDTSGSGNSVARCIGYVKLSLVEVPLNNEPYWYRLARPDDDETPDISQMIPPLMKSSSSSAVVQQPNMQSSVKISQGQTFKNIAQTPSKPVSNNSQSSLVQYASQNNQNVMTNQTYLPSNVSTSAPPSASWADANRTYRWPEVNEEANVSSIPSESFQMQFDFNINQPPPDTFLTPHLPSRSIKESATFQPMPQNVQATFPAETTYQQPLPVTTDQSSTFSSYQTSTGQPVAPIYQTTQLPVESQQVTSNQPFQTQIPDQSQMEMAHAPLPTFAQTFQQIPSAGHSVGQQSAFPMVPQSFQPPSTTSYPMPSVISTPAPSQSDSFQQSAVSSYQAMHVALTSPLQGQVNVTQHPVSSYQTPMSAVASTTYPNQVNTLQQPVLSSYQNSIPSALTTPLPGQVSSYQQLAVSSYQNSIPSALTTPLPGQVSSYQQSAVSSYQNSMPAATFHTPMSTVPSTTYPDQVNTMQQSTFQTPLSTVTKTPLPILSDSSKQPASFSYQSSTSTTSTSQVHSENVMPSVQTRSLVQSDKTAQPVVSEKAPVVSDKPMTTTPDFSLGTQQPVTPDVNVIAGFVPVSQPVSLENSTGTVPAKSILHSTPTLDNSDFDPNDESGHLYKKNNPQVPYTSSSLIRKVARHRSDGSTSSISQEIPKANSSEQVLVTSVSSTPTPDVEKVKRHVRLAPEVSFITGDDEPPISLPLAADPSNPSPTPKVIEDVMTSDLQPIIPGQPSTITERASVGSNLSALVAESVVSEGESALSTNDGGASDADSVIRPPLPASELDIQTTSEYNDPAVLLAKVKGQSLWGKAAKKSLNKLTGKSSFPSVVDSVIAANSKGKKKSGINSGFDISAGFFDGDLGPGQVSARQMLGATAIGELELGLREEKKCLTITLVAARDLIFKDKSGPAIYAKVALVVGQSSQERYKSVPQPIKDCDPQLGIEFPFQTSPFRDKMLQLSLWMAYGKMSGRHCVGAVGIKLDEIPKFPLRAWYKLYDPGAIGGFVAAIASEGPAVGLM